MSTATTGTTQTEVAILARFLANGHSELPPDVAQYILDLQISEQDKVRMHDLAVRN
jgi:hypothetical protein